MCIRDSNNVEFTSSQKYTGKGVIRNLSDAMALGKRWTNVNWETGALITDPAELAAANAATNMWSPYMPQTVVHSWLLEDASFLRLKNLMLSYSFPQEWLRKTRFISGVKIYAQAQNLFTFTKFTGLDPEGSSNMYQAQYPMARQFTFGLDLTF